MPAERARVLQNRRTLEASRAHVSGWSSGLFTREINTSSRIFGRPMGIMSPREEYAPWSPPGDGLDPGHGQKPIDWYIGEELSRFHYPAPIAGGRRGRA